jgi:endonuclease G
MKNLKLTLLLVLVTFSLFAQKGKRDNLLIKTDIYTVMYSEVLEQPKWVEYEVKCPKGSASRAGMDFYTNDSVATSSIPDYADNVWDKGHCAPAADFNCDKETLRKTFSYMNCVLQHERLNRGVWRLLEVHERDLAANAKVSVRLDVIFTPQCEKLSTGATIPAAFKKSIYLNGKLAECYYFDNTAPASSDYNKYKVDCK